ncbi:helix-turn-helix transcriptional regulator [uncultured Sphingomonas sp.]|uniref:LexA family transcriptional regulator n=1 Tax=uncultured Sphingomonas sp. TaxID=158754 RepID=UPI0035CC7CEA
MATGDPRERLRALAGERGDSLAALSAMLGRSHAYLQQWITRGSPKLLTERDRRALADYFGVDEAALGGPPTVAAWRAPRLDVAASAGPGALIDDEAALGASAVPPELARALGLQRGRAAIIRVRGDSMAPGLADGDELLVDEASSSPDARGGVYVVRLDGVLLVKRVRRGARGYVVTSDNPDAPPVGAGDVQVIGRAVWQMRRL